MNHRAKITKLFAPVFCYWDSVFCLSTFKPFITYTFLQRLPLDMILVVFIPLLHDLPNVFFELHFNYEKNEEVMHKSLKKVRGKLLLGERFFIFAF